MRGIFSLVILVGLGLIALSFHFIHQAYRSLDWSPVHARVVHDQCRTSDGTIYRDLVYDYFVIDRAYTSNQEEIGGKSGSHTCEAHYRPGDTIVAYYDPEDPSEAVIKRGGFVGASVWGMGGLLFVFLPWYMVRIARKQPAQGDGAGKGGNTSRR